MRTVIPFLGLFFVCSVTWAQQGRYISGHITDAADGEPIPAVAVFFDNTTVGITTDMEGNYRLSIPGEGSYNLTVSHVGYQSVVKEVEPGMTSMVFDVALQIQELDEVGVSARVRFRRNDINLFWKTILGKNPSRRTIQATNPEVVYYYYNAETQLLKVTCREPLQIVNYETGYHIQCVVTDFTHDYNSGITNWSYQNVFTELEPANLRQKNNWDRKREEIYHVSLTKFIKSLYNNTLHEDGFVLSWFLPTPDPSNPFLLSKVTQESFLSTVSTDNGKTLNLSNLLLVCYGKPVNNDDLAKLARLQTQNERLEDSDDLSGRYAELARQGTGPPNVTWFDYNVQNIRRGAEQYLQNERLENIGLYMNLFFGDSIRIFPDGTYANRFRMAPVNASETLLGLNLRLPLEYLPRESILSGTEIEAVSEADQPLPATIFADIDQRFNEQLSLFPQEKIHLHTDRDWYVPGEKIWFKAYVTDAVTHQYPTNSRYVYVELLSSADTLVNRVMIRQEEGMFHGYLPITEIIPSGDYTLRAYTRYLENLGDDYFFKKNIRIGNITSPKSQVSQSSPTSQLSQRTENSGNSGNRGSIQNDFEVSFYPEGGNLLEGVFGKVAFKALNSDGTSAMITGEIIDENGSIVIPVESFHAGMGAFSYFPDPGKKYRLQCRNSSGLEKQFDLPQPHPSAYALAVFQQNLNNRIAVEMHQSVNAPDIPCYLLAHCRGMVLYFSALNNAKASTVFFSEEDLPAGVIQFILFDEQMNPLSERLVFNRHNASEPVEFQTDKPAYPIRNKVIATIKLDPFSPSLSGRAGVGRFLSEMAWVRSHFSIAITDNRDIAPDSTTTILSSLLLSSELKGYIENPAWYLRDDIKSIVALDYLMLTHGWRRYDVPEVVAGHTAVPSIPYQTGYTFSGSVKSLLLSRPVTGSDVFILADGDIGVTSTDGNGRFVFQAFEYPDSTDYFVQALGGRGGNRVVLAMDDESFPPLMYAQQSLTTSILKSHGETSNDSTLFPLPVGEGREGADAFLVKAEQRSRYDEEMRVIYLDEVVVTAPVIRKEPRLEFWLNKSADRTIPREDIERFSPLLVTDMLRSIAGVRVSPEGYISLCSICPLPLVFIDGMSVEWPDEMFNPWQSPVEQVSVFSVESIDVLTPGVNSAILGVRGAGGAISITTRRLEDIPGDYDHIAVFTPLGYQKPVAFYSPKYETLQAKQSPLPDLRTTIFWKPDVVIADEDEEATFEFYTSDFPTTYSVVIEGLTTNGQIVRQVETIRVE